MRIIAAIFGLSFALVALMLAVASRRKLTQKELQDSNDYCRKGVRWNTSN